MKNNNYYMMSVDPYSNSRVSMLVIRADINTKNFVSLSDEELLDQGIKPNTIRLSIGTEHIDDIIADLENGFAAIKA